MDLGKPGEGPHHDVSAPSKLCGGFDTANDDAWYDRVGAAGPTASAMVARLVGAESDGTPAELLALARAHVQHSVVRGRHRMLA